MKRTASEYKRSEILLFFCMEQIHRLMLYIIPLSTWHWRVISTNILCSSWLSRQSFDSSLPITQDIQEVYQKGGPSINFAASISNPHSYRNMWRNQGDILTQRYEEVRTFPLDVFLHWALEYMGQVTKVHMSCYLVLLAKPGNKTAPP